MSKTQELLALIPDYSEAFADPEDPTLPEPDEEGRTGETPQDGTLLGDASQGEVDQTWASMKAYSRCERLLGQLEDQPLLLEAVANILEQIVSIPQLKAEMVQDFLKSNQLIQDAIAKPVDSGVIEFEQEPSNASAPVFDLPETYARVQTEGCSSGMCPADH
jgi:hypothetical protein